MNVIRNSDSPHGRQKRTEAMPKWQQEVPVPRLGKSDLSQMLSLKVTKAPIYLTPGTEQEQDEPGTPFCTAEQENYERALRLGPKDSGDKAEKLLLVRDGTI